MHNNLSTLVWVYSEGNMKKPIVIFYIAVVGEHFCILEILIWYNENIAYLKVLFEREQGFTMKGNEIGYLSPGSW